MARARRDGLYQQRQRATGKGGFDCPGVHFGRGSVMVGFRRKNNGESYGKKRLWDCGKGEREFKGKGKEERGCVMERSLHRKSSVH